MNKIEVIDATSHVELGLADDVIGELRTRLAGRKADTHAGYEMVRAGIAEVTKYRTGVGRAGKELKASAIAFQKKVNVEVSRVTDLLLEIEMPLREELDRVDKEAERLRNEREEEERLAIESKERAEREAREAEEEAKREAARKEMEAAAAKLEEDRKAIQADRLRMNEELQQKNAELAVERKKVEADKRAILEEARLRELVEREEADAVEAAEQKVRDEHERAMAHERKKVRLAKEKAERERIAEEQLPDREKLKEFARRIEEVVPPRLGTVWGNGVLSEMCDHLQSARDAAYCQDGTLDWFDVISSEQFSGDK